MKIRRVAIYPGTFDPITLGHLHIIKRSAILFDKLIVGIAIDTSKKTLFSIDDRISMLSHEIKKSKLQNLVIKSFKGLLVQLMKDENVGVIVRGVRTTADFEYECQMFSINKMLDSNIEIMFLPATESFRFVSSTFAKEIARLNGNTKNLVTPNVARLMVKRLRNV